MILIVTIENDEHADLVEHQIKKANGKYFRLNTDAISRDFKITYGIRKQNFFAQVENAKGEMISTEDVRVVWYRRTRCNPPAGQTGNRHLFEYSFEEYVGFFKNLWIALRHAKWMDNPAQVHHLQDHRLEQYRHAIQVGLEVPTTYYTNDGCVPISVLKEQGQIAVKPIARAYIGTSSPEEGTAGLPLKGILTRVVRPGDFSEEQLTVSCQNTPIQFQAYVKKEIEIRLTIVGNKLFPCEIHSQKSERTKHDWRRYDFKNVEHRSSKLPQEVEVKVLRFMKSVNLAFGAMDLIRTPDGRYVFLEVNPAGQWHWVEIITKMPISEAISDWLIRHDR